jgi:tRNA(Ile)-lysidine synthase TilS/MesJ
LIKNYRKWFLASVKRAIYDFGMLQDGDRVAVAFSGGKDSVTLLYALDLLSRSLPVKFELAAAVFVKTGWPMDLPVIEEFCRSLNVPFHVAETEIAKIVFEDRKDGSPCAICSHLRRGALHSKVLELGCNKVALGHHLDDVIETFFMSMIYTGQMRVFSPVTFLDRTGLTMIRPLVYHPSENIVSFVEKENLPFISNPCPANGATQREVVKNLIADLVERFPNLKARFLNSLQTFDQRNLWPERIPKGKGNNIYAQTKKITRHTDKV